MIKVQAAVVDGQLVLNHLFDVTVEHHNRLCRKIKLQPLLLGLLLLRA